MKSFSYSIRIGILLTSISLLAACQPKHPPQMPPPTVSFVTITAEPIAITNELSGRLESFKIAEVRARVPGIIQNRSFVEGSEVQQGSVLFHIDPRNYQANKENAEATLARAEANLVQINLKVERYEPLVQINAISKQEFDDAIAMQKQAIADVTAAKAKLTSAKLDLEYANVTAPISGKIGRAMVTEGALVGQGEATLLTTIQQINPIYVNLTQSSNEILQLRQAIESGQLKSSAQNGLKATLIMEDGTVYPHVGTLLFSDISVDPTTGDVTIRALFPNPKRMLLPGMFVRAKLEQALNENGIAVPQQAIQRSTDGAAVMVVGADNKVEIRPVKTGPVVGNKWIINQGLQPGDKVIIEGLQKIRPGAPVNPVVWQEKPATPGGNPAMPNDASKPAAIDPPKASDSAAPKEASQKQSASEQK